MAETPRVEAESGGKAQAETRSQMSPAAVREELARVLASTEFRTSRRCQDFLRYVVETSLAGHADQLKERTIGIDVFGKPAAYDPGDDATVRVKAGEVRKRLGLYYAGQGRDSEIRIDVPGGGYVPEFRSVAPRVTEAPVLASSPSDVRSQTSSRFQFWNRWSALGLGAVCLVGVLGWAMLRWSDAGPPGVLRQFWEPVVEQASAPVLLSAAYVPVYAMNKPPGTGAAGTVGDFTPLNDSFIGGGDLLAVVDLAHMLDRMHRPWQVKVGTEASFTDLRSSPTVLVGYSYTRWREISKEMRFFIDAEKRPLMIWDNGKPTEWSLPKLKPDLRTDEDYAIVSRVFHPDTRTLLVEVAGITQYGTTAAAELVTNADLLEGALKSAPRGWEKKNLQLVLHTKVISGMAASQRVVATYFW